MCSVETRYAATSPGFHDITTTVRNKVCTISKTLVEGRREESLVHIVLARVVDNLSTSELIIMYVIRKLSFQQPICCLSFR